jgi:hypothetical protein
MKLNVTLLLAVLLTGCSQGGGGAPTDPPPGGPIVRQVSDDLSTYVGTSINYIQGYSEGYVVPSATQLGSFDSLITDLIGRNIEAVAAAAGSLNFELIEFTDTGAGNNRLYCLRELAARGQGFYCVDYDATRSHHISVPHPLYDRDTNTESVTVMRNTGARYLSVSTSHRCANNAESACSGTTTACGVSGPYKVSDAAHNVNGYFYHFGTNVHDQNATTHTLQLHGCGSSTCPSNYDDADIVARLSAGTTMDLASTELVNILNAALNAEIAPYSLGVALSCSEPGADKQLCGTTNTLGRYINGQANPCQNSATSFIDSRWLHIEQNRNLRVDDGAGDEITPGALVDAINDTLLP